MNQLLLHRIQFLKKLKKMKFDLSYEVKSFPPFTFLLFKKYPAHWDFFILVKYLNILTSSIISTFGISHQHFH